MFYIMKCDSEHFQDRISKNNCSSLVGTDGSYLKDFSIFENINFESELIFIFCWVCLRMIDTILIASMNFTRKTYLGNRC